MAQDINRPRNTSLRPDLPNFNPKGCFFGFIGVLLFVLLAVALSVYFDIK